MPFVPAPKRKAPIESRFISGLKNAEVEVDRKNLSDLAIHEPAAFAELVEIANKANADHAG